MFAGGSQSRLQQRSSVDLPLPLGPIKLTILPDVISKEMLWRMGFLLFRDKFRFLTTIFGAKIYLFNPSS